MEKINLIAKIAKILNILFGNFIFKYKDKNILIRTNIFLVSFCILFFCNINLVLGYSQLPRVVKLHEDEVRFKAVKITGIGTAMYNHEQKPWQK